MFISQNIHQNEGSFR